LIFELTLQLAGHEANLKQYRAVDGKWQFVRFSGTAHIQVRK
jgi:hypothetical protein